MKSVSIVLLCLGLLMTAQSNSNLEGTQGLHRVTSAKTSGAKKMTFTLGMESGWGREIVKGNLTNFSPDGEQSKQDIKWLYTSTMNLGFSLGLDDDWDGGVVLPIHIDYLEFEGSTFSNLSDASNADMGDLKFWSKHRLPFTRYSSPWQWAGQGQGSMNTGSEKNGFLPKRRHLIPENSRQKMAPYSASISTLGLGLSFAYLGERDKSKWNFHSSADVRFATGLSLYPALFWGLGLEHLTTDWLSLFIEYAGETRYNKDVSEDPQFITPGVRFLMWEKLSLSMALDYNPTWDASAETYTLDYNLVDSKRTQFDAHPSHELGISAVLAYAFGGEKDTDGDEVLDKDDKCPQTPLGDKVDKRGCSLDGDMDGVVDRLDLCPTTRSGASVDTDGCALDTDKDGVIDLDDKCLNTREGAPVDSQGCALDTDLDGVIDLDDKCPNTREGAPVDSVGCALDTDKDGVIDMDDKCLETPEGAQVNKVGCQGDKDEDGVVDGKDDCPNTMKGASVDTKGCALDTDKDNVIDLLDKCPETPTGVAVDKDGCPLDSDGDGVYDYIDQCPRTLKGVQVDAVGCPLKKEQDLSQLQKAINFETGSSKLTPASLPTLDLVVKLLLEFKDVALEIQGHTDSKGRYTYNLNLSQRRADAVMDYMLEQGLEVWRLKAKGYGPDLPVADNDTKEGRSKNRRVELVPVAAVPEGE